MRVNVRLKTYPTGEWFDSFVDIDDDTLGVLPQYLSESDK